MFDFDCEGTTDCEGVMSDFEGESSEEDPLPELLLISAASLFVIGLLVSGLITEDTDFFTVPPRCELEGIE